MPEELSLLKDKVEKEAKEALAPPAPSYAARSLYRNLNTDTALLKFCPPSYPPTPYGGPPAWPHGPSRRGRTL